MLVPKSTLAIDQFTTTTSNLFTIPNHSQQHHHIRSFTTTSCSNSNHHWKLFWTSYNFVEPEETNKNRLAFSRPLKSGILAVLLEPDRPTQVLYRMPSLPSLSKPIPSIRRPSLHSQASDVGGQTQSVPSRRFQQHLAPMKVLVLSCPR